MKFNRLVIFVILLAGLSFFSDYKIYAIRSELDQTIASSTSAYNSLNDKYKDVLEENGNLTSVLSDTQKEKLDLERTKKKNERKIDTLTKLTTLDPELLKKYSKIYFLNENYVPPELDNIDSKYLINPATPKQILSDVAPFLDDLLASANEDGVNLRIASAYRSFTEQKSLKSTYVVTYGAGTANQFSAEQGYSEHQLGTAVDFATPAHPSASPGFENTSAYPWLLKNAYRFGFILSYPASNTYYKYEPWHWRFVGRDLARDLHDDNKNFYDWDQRQIDEYLINIFD